jgi:hypothetical protein
MKQKIINAYVSAIDRVIIQLIAHNNSVKVRFPDIARQRKAKNKLMELCKNGTYERED